MLKKIFNVFKILILIILLAIIVSYFLGFRYMFVLTKSMEPTIKVDDLIITKPMKLNELKKNDIITINVNGDKNVKLTHRIVRIDIDNKLIYTKGDNNPSPDSSPTKYEYVLGKVIFVVPAAGKIFIFFKTPIGIGCLIVILVLTFMIDGKSSKKNINKL